MILATAEAPLGPAGFLLRGAQRGQKPRQLTKTGTNALTHETASYQGLRQVPRVTANAGSGLVIRKAGGSSPPRPTRETAGHATSSGLRRAPLLRSVPRGSRARRENDRPVCPGLVQDSVARRSGPSRRLRNARSRGISSPANPMSSGYGPNPSRNPDDSRSRPSPGRTVPVGSFRLAPDPLRLLTPVEASAPVSLATALFGGLHLPPVRGGIETGGRWQGPWRRAERPRAPETGKSPLDASLDQGSETPCREAQSHGAEGAHGPARQNSDGLGGHGLQKPAKGLGTPRGEGSPRRCGPELVSWHPRLDPLHPYGDGVDHSHGQQDNPGSLRGARLWNRRITGPPEPSTLRWFGRRDPRAARGPATIGA
jgi:hypothetical protein